jgi:hypothetical protein
MARQIVVDIVGDSKGFSKSAGDAVKASETMASRIKSIGKGIPSAMLGGLGIGAGIGVFSMVTSAIGGVTDALGDAVEAAKEDQAATARLNTMLQANIKGWDGNTDAIEAAIDAGARLAFTDDDIREGLNELVPRTHDLNEALKLNSLAMDLARAKGMSLEEAASLVGKAYSGQVGALRRAGVAISANLKPTEALAQLQKQVAGQAKSYANTAAGSAEAVQIQISEAMESIGYALIPLVAEFTSFAADTIPVVIDSLGGLGDAFNNLHRFMDPGLAAQQDFEEAVRRQAVAAGVSADAVIKQTEALRLQAAVEKDREDQYATFEGFARTALGLFGDLTEAQQEQVDAWIAARQAEEDLAFVNEGYLADKQAMATADGKATEAIRLYKEQLAAVTEQWLDLGVNATYGSKAWSQQNQLMADNADLLNASFADLPAELQQAMRDAGLAVEQGATAIEEGADDATTAMLRLKHSGKTVAPAIRQDLSPLAGIVKGTLKRAKEEALTGMAELNWSLKHPLQGAKLEAFYEGQMDKAYRKLRRAQREGNIDAIAKAQALISGLREKLNELRSVRISIQTSLDNRAEHRAGSRGFEYRASGGPVQRGRPYIVGEDRPEVFVPDQNGTIVPSVSGFRAGSGGSSQGGGGVTVYMTVNVAPTADRASIGREILGAIKAASRMDGGVALRAAMTGS